MCTAVISSIPRIGVSGTRKPWWKDRSIRNARFAVLKRQMQFLRTDKDTKNNNRLSVPGRIVLQKSPSSLCEIEICNDRIGARAPLNRCCAFAPDLESMLRDKMLKILLQHNPPDCGLKSDITQGPRSARSRRTRYLIA